MGIVVSADSIGYFPLNAPMAKLERLCPVGDTTLFDAIGWQAPARVFRFAGATIVAVQGRLGCCGPLSPTDSADYWTAEGDSVRLADGALVPRTLGGLRVRYGVASAGGATEGDDPTEAGARSCRFR